MIYNLQSKLGYTLVELMIVISIVGILVTFGVSAYGRGREKQAGQAAGEQIISILNASQKLANIGNKDCIGKFTGQQVVFAPPNLLKTRSRCGTNPPGTETTFTVPEITGMTSATIVFNPLSLGINLGTTNPLTISYTGPSGATYRVLINKSGTIEYKGTP